MADQSVDGEEEEAESDDISNKYVSSAGGTFTHIIMNMNLAVKANSTFTLSHNLFMMSEDFTVQREWARNMSALAEAEMQRNETKATH